MSLFFPYLFMYLSFPPSAPMYLSMSRRLSTWPSLLFPPWAPMYLSMARGGGGGFETHLPFCFYIYVLSCFFS